jgi:phage tail-like protein
LKLFGEGAQTPVIRRARVFYPRKSSLRFLPAAYSEDDVSRDFLGRFLSIFDSVRGEAEQAIAGFARYLEPGAAPTRPAGTAEPDFLAWLASWIGLTLDRHWPEDRRRELVRRAHELYRLRGTAAGLEEHIKLYTGFAPRILEHFKLRRWLYLDHSRLGDQSALYGAAIVNRLQLGEHSTTGSFQLVDTGDPLRDPFHVFAHQFTVFATVRGEATDQQRQTLERIIELAKPAHALARLEIVHPRLRIGTQSLVGIDTIIGRPPQGTATGKGRLGYDSVLGERTERHGTSPLRIGSRSRIGSNTVVT